MSDAVLVPVYNEEQSVTSVLSAIRCYYGGEVIVIDDGSTDDTPRALAELSDVSVVRLDHNCGYGCALRIGFDVARDLGVSRLITMDCDGQHEPAHIPQFFDALGSGADIISGSRYLPQSGSSGEAPADRRELNARVTAVINGVTGWGLTDSFCGFKAYNLDVLSKVKVSEPGYAMPLELWAKAWRQGLVVQELPVERIYCSRDRSFGEALDDPEARYAYYMDVWHRSLEES